MKKASVIIVNLNGRRLLEGLLPGLLDQELSGYAFEVLIVDNGSNDNSVKFIEEQYPGVRLLCLEQNLGFSPAVNKGIAETDGEYVVLLNNDCHVRSNWLAELLAPFSISENVACTGSLILDLSGRTIDYQCGTGNIFGWGFHRDRGLPANEAVAEPFRTFFTCGAACAFRRDILAEAGGMLDEMFAYFEDVEIGWRLNALGYEVWMAPASVVEHHHGATVSRFGKGFHEFLTERNALINAWCNLSANESAVVLPLALSMSSLRFAAKAGLTPDIPLGMEGMNAILSARGDEALVRKVTEELRDLMKKRVSVIGIDRGAAVEAGADFGMLLPRLEERRKSLQANRKVMTKDLLDIMGEPFRAVIGHPRENAFIEEIEPFLREIIG